MSEVDASSQFETLRRYVGELEDLRRVAEHLVVDQQTAMPVAATAHRSRQIGLLEAEMQRRLKSDRLAELLEAVPTEEVPWLATIRADHERARQLPEATVESFASTSSEAFAVWQRARAAGDWGLFAPWLERMVAINLEVAEALGYDEHPLDALLSMYEPGPSASEVDDLFNSLKDVVLNVQRERFVGDPETSARLDRDTLLNIAGEISKMVGFDFDRGALAFSPHGYTNPGGPNDIRVTFREDVSAFEAISTLVHELGHALYEQGISPELWGTSSGRGIMPYVHESQAKFWENVVGRRPDFCRLIGDVLARHLGEGTAVSWGDAYWRSQTQTPSSTVRIATDEVSFNSHIFLRWEIEREVLSERIRVDEIPDLWNTRSEEYFGRVPESATVGVLQDPHWCRRYMGLFTSYVIGNAASAQIFEAMEVDGVALGTAIANRDFQGPLAWLRGKIHGPGRSMSMKDLLTSATGQPLTADAYQRHLVERYLTQ